MATSEVENPKSRARDDSDLLVLGSDLVVEASAFVGSSETSTSSPQCRSESQLSREFSDLDQLQFLRLQGVDRHRRRIVRIVGKYFPGTCVRIVGKYFPATVIDGERLKEYIASKLTNEIEDEQFCIVYFHTTVERGENSPGMFTLRHIYEDLPQVLRQRLGAIYVVHPGLRSTLLLATVGRFFLSEGFYSKVTYISRVEFLWDHITKKDQVEVPQFVLEHDEDLENRPLMDYGLEVEPYGYLDGPGLGVARLHARSFG